jgi:phosphoglycerol transferase MdoB-like AlkP superfamily enzyme
MPSPKDLGTSRGNAYPISQLAISAALVAGSRLLTGVRPDVAGVLDDASLAALFAAAQVVIAGWIPWPRVRVTAAVLGLVALSLSVFTNQVFFSFFHTNLSVASLQLMGIAVDARSSIKELLSASNVIALLLAPIAAQLWIAARWARPGVGRGAGWGFLFAGLLLAGLSSGLRHPVLIFAQHNPTLALVRDVSARALTAAGISDDSALGGRQDVLSLLNREGYPGYEPAGGAEHPLLQRPLSGETEATRRPNVVLILMESMRGYETQGAFRELPVTPVLNALEQDSVVFPNFYANGMTTVSAEFSILCSALPVVNEAPVYVRNFELDIRCLPEILKQHGYGTHWISAYRSSYANKQQFLRRHGVDQVHDESSMDPKRARHPTVGWGMGDVDMFEQALSKLDAFPEPFFSEIMTLSNHHPFDHDYDLNFPASFEHTAGNDHYRGYQRGMYYTDHAIGGFLAAARERPWFERTLFVILGDHAVRAYPDATSPTESSLGPVLETEIYFRSKLLLYAPEWLDAARIDVLGSQIDVAPTILDVLGIRTENSFLGVSLLAEVAPDRRFALMNIGHVFNIRSGDQYCYSVGYTCFESVFPRCPRGVAPTSAGHTCFELESDLFDVGDDPPKPLDALERARTLDRASRIMELNRRMIEQGRFR